MPVIPGHQAVGIVDTLGPGLAERLPSARRRDCLVAVHLRPLRNCAAARENLCEQTQFTGYHADGGYAEYAVVREDFAYEIPAAYRDVEAAPLLCAGIIGYRALERANLPRGGTLAMYGFGSSAHVLIQIARHRGCEVHVVTRKSAIGSWPGRWGRPGWGPTPPTCRCGPTARSSSPRRASWCCRR